MKASFVAILPVVAGCHLASGIDEMKIDRRVAEVPKEKFACEAFADDFEELDASQWQEVDSGEGVELVHDADITGVIIDLDDAGAGARGGILAGTKVDFNACSIIVEVDPAMEADAFAMVALVEEPSDEEPVIAIRKEGSRLIASREGDDFASIAFNEEQRFWRIRQAGEQIHFEESLHGTGEWETVGRVAKPEAVRAVYPALLGGTSAPVESDAVVFFSYEVVP